MRIAVFGVKTLPAFAGADRVVERLIDHLPEHDFTIYLASDSGRPHLTCTEHLRYVYIPTLAGKHLRAFSFFLLSSLHFLIKGRADVAHVHNVDFGLFCPVLKLKRRTPVLGTSHGSPYVREKWGSGAKAFLRLSEWAFVHSCDALTSVSPTWLPRAEYIPNGVDAAESPVVGSGFDYDELGLIPGHYVLFACGRLDSTKGLHHLLEAYRSMPSDEKLLAIGDFSHDAGYSRLIEEAALTDPRVVLFKFLLERSALFDVIRNSSVFVFPSEHEAMSMMLLETIACRKVVVCSDIPENLAVVGDDYPFLFRSRDPESLAATLGRAKNSDAVVSRRYEEIESLFRWEEIARRYDTVFRRLAGRSPTPSR